MKLEDILNVKSTIEVSKETGLPIGTITPQKLYYGFSANSCRAFLSAYPNIDLRDLLLNYPSNRT